MSAPDTGGVIDVRTRHRSIAAALAFAVAARLDPEDVVVVRLPYVAGVFDRELLAELVAAGPGFGVSVVRAADDLRWPGQLFRAGEVRVSGDWRAVSRYLQHWRFRTGQS